MTTWYTAQGPGGPMWSYSVRPDIWPAGTCAWVTGLDPGWLADFNAEPWRSRPAQQSGAPGAAEALILADLVSTLTQDATGLTWTPEVQ